MDLQNKIEILNSMTDGERPFPVDRVYRDGAMLIATNGRQVLTFQLAEDELSVIYPALDEGAEEYKKGNKKAERSKSGDYIREWLTQEATTYAVNSRSLLDFLRAEEYLKCPCCFGSGRRPIASEYNDEFGWFRFNDPFESSRIVELAGALINATFLLTILARLPVGEAISLSTWPAMGIIGTEKSKGHILRLVGDGWTMIQMSMTKVEGYQIDVFPLAEVSA